jgi:hypothetical protein
MAGGGYRGILAAVPTAQNLHSAFRRGKKIKSKSEAAYRPAYHSSPLPQIIGGAPPNPVPGKNPNVGAGLLAKADWHPPLMSIDTAPSSERRPEQARSHIKQIGVQLLLLTTQQAER